MNRDEKLLLAKWVAEFIKIDSDMRTIKFQEYKTDILVEGDYLDILESWEIFGLVLEEMEWRGWRPHLITFFESKEYGWSFTIKSGAVDICFTSNNKDFKTAMFLAARQAIESEK